MKTFLLLIALCFLGISNAIAQTCSENAKVVEPAMSAGTKKNYLEKLAAAEIELGRNPRSPDALVWVGRRTAYLGQYKEAIRLFTDGVKKFPNDARLYRHRGHRYITLRCFDDAIKDFEKAAKLVKGKPDEVEPDGLPNAKNIPTSTLQSNIWYHLGLAYYLKRDFKKALKAYNECEKVSKNPDMLVATKHWQYMTLRRMGKKKQAEKAIAGIGDNLDIIENDDYYKLVKLYQRKLKPEELLGKDFDSLGNASLGYGIGNWYFYIGETEKGLDIFRRITSGKQWASFGFIAAEAELK
jgi:tetratricopeptide (TPR) repeat protein